MLSVRRASSRLGPPETPISPGSGGMTSVCVLGVAVAQICRQFRGVTMVLLVNKTTRASLEATELCTILKVIKLGGVEAVLLTT